MAPFLFSFSILILEVTSVTTVAAHSLRRRKRINWQKILLIVTFSAVPLFLLALFTYVPFAKMIKFSFFDMYNYNLNSSSNCHTNCWKYQSFY